MEFKENLKRVRMEKGLTQAQLAEKLVALLPNGKTVWDYQIPIPWLH